MIEYVPLECLVLVGFIHAVCCLVLVGSNLHTPTDVNWFVCGCMYGIGDI